ncbi:MAG: hypothetical protein ACOX7Q_14185 [Kiritimatiellia bacterium]|jgi:hypothetical protein
MLKKMICGYLCAVGVQAEVLTWNGVDGDTWGGAAQNWMDDKGTACAWKNGAEAVFAGSACRVRVLEGVTASRVRFRSNGFCLEGLAEIPEWIADAGTSNAVALVDTAPRVTVRGGGMVVCAQSARFVALNLEEGLVRLADDGVTAKVHIGAAACLHATKDLAFEELSGTGRLWTGEFPRPEEIPFENDFDSGLSTNKTYTHLLDFGPNPTNAVACWVTFRHVNGPGAAGVSGLPGSSGNLMRMENVGVPRHHGLYSLFSDFAWGFTPEKPIEFKGLKKGHWHRITIYQRAFEASGSRGRPAVLSFDMDGDGPLPPASITTWQNFHPVSRITYPFYAVEEDSLTLRICNLDPARGYHLYGLSIELCDDPRAAQAPIRVTAKKNTFGSASVQVVDEAPVLYDLMCDTWAAVDGLGRELPDAAACGAPRTDRSVGIFYWTWHRDELGPYDNTKLTANARDGIVSWPPCTSHWWGESEYGYYRATDEYVLTHHAILLAAAGVDAVFFDTTNPPWTFKEQYEALCRAWTRLREQGTPTPQIAFICPFTFSGRPERAAIVLDQLWYDLYRPGKWKDLWYRWQGKPLVLADPRCAKLPGMKEFFTFRYPEADYRRGPWAPDQWSWLEVSPQHVFTNSLGQAEQMSVGVAVNALPGQPGPAPMSHKDGAMGRSWHDGAIDPDPAAVNRGIFFQNQWDWALKHDPLFIFVTGWNEWRAGRMTKWSRFDAETDCYFPGGLFVDQYNQEYSRDCEPMKGGHGDNYYYQLAANIRRYKGARSVPVATNTYAISVDGSFDDWAAVQPTYRDAIGDVIHRNHRGCGQVHYTDTSGRNDIAKLKVAETPQGQVAFYAQTANFLSPHTDPNWMVLFVNADAQAETGWYGYDLRVNRMVSADGTRASLDVWRGSPIAGHWENVSFVPIRIGAREVELLLPQKLFGSSPLKFEFHWKDNPESLDRHPTIQGDDAPERRFNYVFKRQ